MKEYLTLSEAAELIGKSKETLRRWDREGKLSAVREPMSNYRVYHKEQVETLFADFLIQSNIEETVSNFVEPENEYTVLELFAGAGGLAGNTTTLPPVIVRREFGAVSFGAVFGIAAMLIQIMSAMGPAFFGVLHDLSGSYQLPLGLAAILNVVAAIVIMTGRKR